MFGSAIVVSGHEVTQSPTEHDGQSGGGKRMEWATPITGVTESHWVGQRRLRRILVSVIAAVAVQHLLCQHENLNLGPQLPCGNQAQKHL